MGGQAVVNGADVTDFDEAGAMVQQAIDTFGRLDILVNNAGILRDRMIFSMTEAEWDAVVAVHLKGHFCPTRHAAAYWREQSKAGETVDARIINTASASGLFGNAGQANYGAAKAGIAAFTNVCALELGRLGVTANCLAPVAITRLVAPLMGGEDAISDEVKEAIVAPLDRHRRHLAGQPRGGGRDRPHLRRARREGQRRRGLARRAGRAQLGRARGGGPGHPGPAEDRSPQRRPRGSGRSRPLLTRGIPPDPVGSDVIRPGP